MKLTFLGTAASEGLPAVWCNCPTCRAAKHMGGRDIRTRSQILIDDCVLMDFPMDTYMHALQNNLDLSNVDTALITHAHMDHFYPQEFILHGDPFAHNMTKPVLTVYGDAAVMHIFEEATHYEMRGTISPSVPHITIAPYTQFVTASGYKVTALPAQHTKNEDCLIYAVEKDGKTVLLFNDSGILPDATYARMASLGLKFDAVSFDCTYGHVRHGEGRHMGALDALDERAKMQKHGLLHAHTQYILTHFSHNSDLSYEQLIEKETPNGFIIAYDGMVVEV